MSAHRGLLPSLWLLLPALCLACPSSRPPGGDGDGDADDDGGGPGDCSDVDGDGYGVGPDCTGEDCDEGNPGRQSGCAEDCNALPQDVGCPCDADEQVVPCFDADPTLAGIGACATGLKTCRDGTWGYCQNQTLPRDEDD